MIILKHFAQVGLPVRRSVLIRLKILTETLQTWHWYLQTAKAGTKALATETSWSAVKPSSAWAPIIKVWSRMLSERSFSCLETSTAFEPMGVLTICANWIKWDHVWPVVLASIWMSTIECFVDTCRRKHWVDENTSYSQPMLTLRVLWTCRVLVTYLSTVSWS